MKKLICIFLFVMFLTPVYAQQSPRFIVRGDDMGFSHSGNEALIKCYTGGVESSIEVIVPSPWFPEAVKLLKQNPGIDVGVHLAITSEWDNIKWRPVSDCRSLKDSNGYFYPMIYPNKNYPGQSILENKWNIADIEKEFRAQIEMAIKLIPRVSHISPHMGCTGMNDEVNRLTKRLAKEYHLVIESDLNISPVMVSFAKGAKTTAEKIQSFMDIINKMEPSKTYIFIDHPGLDNSELRAIYLKGDDQVAKNRQAVTDVYTNEKVKALIKEKGIKLIGYRDLVIQ